MTQGRPGERWYRRLLHLYPKDFREEYGAEMARLYRDRRREERWWRLWISLLLDFARTAPSEHLAMLKQDLRHAWRSLGRTPVITATAILTLAIGVGASTAMFSVVHAVLLRPLPYPESDRLVEFFESNLKDGVVGMRVSALNYLSWAERSTSFDAIAAFNSSAATLTDNGDPELIGGSVVTASLFRVLRVAPIVGRPLQAADEQRASARVVVLSEALWRDRFGSDERIVGRFITLDGERHQVVGVMPRTFREVGRAQASGIAGAQIFLPMAIDRTRENRGNHVLRVVGRLRHGVPLEQARSEMRAVSAGLEREFPTTNTNWSARIEMLLDTTSEPHVRQSLLLLFGAVALVFFIACANVANLMLARGTRRHPELAVRAALGAGRARLVRQLLTESSCLAVISGVAGMLGAAIAHPLLRSLLPPALPRLDETHLDVTVLVFGLSMSLTSGVVFGVVPAFRSARLDLSQSLTGRTTTDRTHVRLRQVLVAAQIAVATTLLVGGALLLQGFARLQRVPLGFAPDDVFTGRLSLPRSRYDDADRAGEFFEQLVNRLQASGRLHSVALATSAPFAPGVRASFQPGARTQPSARIGTPEPAAEHIVNGEYFRVLAIPLISGRSFTERDTPGAVGAAIVSQRLARLFWPDTNPLGQTVERNGRSYEIVGIVGDLRGSDTQGLRGGGADRDPHGAIYFAAGQLPQRTMTLLVRPSGDPAAAIAAIRHAIRELDPMLPLQQVRPLRDWLTESLAPTRLTTRLATIFAITAVLLASIGVYGVLAYSVASRTREIGLRMAIGASRRRVIGLVLWEGMTWAGAGIIIGLIGALAATRLLANLVFGVSARDPATFAAIGAAMIVVALAASAIPAIRAIRIDPTLAIRTE